MLEIRNIVKDYNTDSETVHALKGVSIAFRESELVSVLGQSGCGKTTLLNIIGGLDQYTSGDLIINGQSTKQYKSADWDVYRNHSVGFIFQSYNLIPHQSVLSNVELALTLSGVSKTERRRRAKEALEKVGLGNQLNKRPNQMSGGQMQRVAIARALVNDPDILLADEPTGALDSETSIQIMELIKEIAKDRLVIMVTHNPDLAEKYSTRIVKLLDGEIVGDSDPYDPAGEESAAAVRKSEVTKGKKTSMSFGTALSLSRNNLMTKKGRTFLTAFAGSIGIIGIALILSLSNGVQEYINSVERSTLASFPVSLQKETVDYTSLMTSMMNVAEESKTERDPDKIYTNDISTEMVKTMLSEMQTNNLSEFKEYLESNPDNIMDSISEINYSYDSELYIYGHDLNGNLIQVNPSTVIEAMMGESMADTMSQMTETYSSMMGGTGSQYDAWEELLSSDMLETEYEVLAGRLPESYNEVVLLVSDRNELSDITLYSLGLRDQSELEGMMANFMAGESIEIDTGDLSFTYDELMGLEFSLLTAPDFYQKNEDGGYTDMRGDEEFMEAALENAPKLKVVGILKPDADSLISSTNSGGIGYTHALTEFMIDRVNSSDIVKEQKNNPDVDVFTGIEFPKADEEEKEAMSESAAMESIMEMLSDEQKQQLNQGIMDSLTEEQLADIQTAMLSMVSDEQMHQFIMDILTPEQLQQLAVSQDTELASMLTEEQQKQLSAAITASLTPEQNAELSKLMNDMLEPAKVYSIFMQTLTSDQLTQLMELTREPETTEATYDGNLKLLGVAELSEPSSMKIYATDFESKETITHFIEEYNNRKLTEDKQEDVINYTDYVGLMMSSVSDIINAISYILIAFVAISLVVSSIMIGIITYISVLERTKEVGILRAMGASKMDISNVFNAETLIVGFSAGVIGIGVTLLLNIPINIIIENITGIQNVALLPWQGGVILIVISMLLTVIAGLFPASVAAKRDPVVALRTE